MSLAATVKAMAAAGMSAEQIADVVDRMEEARLSKQRTGNARRQAEWRAARRNENNADNGVTHVTGVTQERPQTPKESPPLPSPPKGGSVRPPAGGLDDPKNILAEVLPVETAAEVVAHRKALKSPLTAGSARGLAKNFKAYGDPVAAAQAMMAGGWRGFKPEWMRDARAGPSIDGAASFMRRLHEENDGQGNFESEPFCETGFADGGGSGRRSATADRDRDGPERPYLDLVAIGAK